MRAPPGQKGHACQGAFLPEVTAGFSRRVGIGIGIAIAMAIGIELTIELPRNNDVAAKSRPIAIPIAIPIPTMDGAADAGGTLVLGHFRLTRGGRVW